MLILLFVGGLVASCSKDKDEEDETVNRADFEKAYFGIANGDFQGKSLPGSNSESLEILGITGNPTILAGGSNIIHLSASDGATEAIVGVKDQKGYYTVPITADRNGANRGIMSLMDIRLIIGQQVADNFTIRFAVSDGQGNFSEYQDLVVNLLEAGTGLLQVNLVWDQLNDVDLHLIEPDSTEIYFGNTVSTSGGQLDVDSNPACEIDGINNENIYYEDDPSVTIPYGEYQVLVDLYANCDIAPNTNYTIVVHYGGELIATTEGVNPSEGVLTPADESGNTNLIPVMKFEINGPPSPRASTNNPNTLNLPKLYKFSFDKNNKVFKNFSPKK
ncbi:hypothetical protein EI546_08285 [Aequorivita sp. H23M31]|uniref:Uncharacterized protein n=1 Tax=Aequorivita ciconiae TaxID=2494375 RepID=A0A410G365_9FLAO|nr:hypothetical protein [Aequorivita sp. H23M31]QAA81722.1 hypothetical protein EI546_08285 [Aequorivita sp. H23M31]